MSHKTTCLLNFLLPVHETPWIRHNGKLLSVINLFLFHFQNIQLILVTLCYRDFTKYCSRFLSGHNNYLKHQTQFTTTLKMTLSSNIWHIKEQPIGRGHGSGGRQLATQSYSSPCTICGGQSGTRTGFSPTISLSAPIHTAAIFRLPSPITNAIRS